MFWNKNTTQEIENNKRDFTLNRSVYGYNQYQELEFDGLDSLTLSQRLEKVHLTDFNNQCFI